MFVVIPFCHKDEALCLKQLEWARRLDKSTDRMALVVHDDTVKGENVVEAAGRYFRDVKEFVYPKWSGNEQWPVIQNNQFQQACGWIEYNGPKEPWFWWEPDATPLQAGWLDKLEEEYKEGGKPFMGHVLSGDPFQNGRTHTWMTGVGVYPKSVLSHSGNIMGALNVPWDVAGGGEVTNQCHKANHLIQHIWARDGAPFHFIDKADANSVILPSAVVFHRCKDGSLIDILNGEPLVRLAVNSIANAAKAVSAFASRLFTSKQPTAVVQLGRFGDLVNALPAIRMIAVREESKPTVIVGKEFFKILDGVTYADAEIFEGVNGDLNAAIEHAKAKHERVVVGQVWGTDFKVEQFCTTYNIDNWERLGAMERWSENVLPVFDARSYDRERKWIDAQTKKIPSPIVLTSLGGGVTSKLANFDKIRGAIKSEFEKRAQIVDLDSISFERVYDVLGLMEIADAIVTSDTVWLHLASDTNTPVAAFLSPKGRWMRTETRCNCTLKLVDESDDSIEKLLRWLDKRITKASNRKYVHCCEAHRPVPKRVKKAQSTWTALQDTGRWQIALLERYPRDTRLLGEDRSIPFLRDVLEYGLHKCEHDDILVMSNDDTIITKDTIGALDIMMSQVVAATSGRIDIDSWTGHPPTGKETTHAGRDIIVFRASWLRKHFHEIPDYALGICDWDHGMAAAIRWWCGREWRLANAHLPADCCELPPGYVLHEIHAPTWTDDSERMSPGLKYNRKLLKGWAEAHDPGIGDGIPWWHKV